MKKIVLSLVAPFIAIALSAAGVGTTSHEEADAIVLERLNQETRPYTLYVTRELQKDMRIISSAEELLELNYWCWVYYVNYTDLNQGRYLIVKEANGNLLEVDAKSGAKPEDLGEWKEVTVDNYPIDIPFTEYSLAETLCQWKSLSYLYPYSDTVVVINNEEDLEKYIECIGENNYPIIDFSTHTLLFAYGVAPSSVVNFNCNSLQQLSEQSYEMDVEIIVGDATVISNWQVPIMVNKLDEGCIIELIVTIKFHKL